MATPVRACLSRRSAVIRGLFTRQIIQQTYALPKRHNNGYVGMLQLGCFNTVPIYQRHHSFQLQQNRNFHTSLLYRSSEDAVEQEEQDEYHSIIKNTERSKGPSDKHEFQAETRQLLDIVARSLYSEKEVFIRELISNASDALEKFRYLQMTDNNVTDRDTPLEIHIATDETMKTFTIQDTGLGMLKDEMVDNLGTIARSGSKAFLETVQSSSDVNSNIIGQFGVGFYSSFMVGSNVDVYSQSYKPGNPAHKWTSDGTGMYELAEAEGVQRGTKIVVHLKGECAEFCREDVIKEVIQKYSNFVGVPIYLNGKRVNIVQPLWAMDPREVTEDMHEEFYRFIANAYDKHRYHMHYRTDAPLDIRALIYIPEHKPNMFDMSRETDVSLQLYSRKVLIMTKANAILPKWLRFVRGVVDSEDIPLNLSRELLQDSVLIRKLNQVLTNRLLKFFLEQSKKDKETYLKFFEDYGMFFREGIVTSPDQDTRESIAKLLRFESSKMPEGETTSMEEYCTRMKAGSREIYYLAAPSRELAESSPYMEAMREKDAEVLFLYESYDELTLMNLGQFDKKNLKSVESEITEDKEETGKVDETDPNSLKQEDAEILMNWLKTTLLNKVNKVKITKKLSAHPCVVTVQEMGSARHFLKTTFAEKSQEERFRLLQPTLEINPSHPLIKKLSVLQADDPYLAKLVAEQLYDNAMVTAGLMDDPRSMVTRLNQLLEKALNKV